MGMLYRRKQKNEAGKFVEVGPWWMKYYDNGRPIYQGTGTFEKTGSGKYPQESRKQGARGQA